MKNCYPGFNPIIKMAQNDVAEVLLSRDETCTRRFTTILLNVVNTSRPLTSLQALSP